MKYSALHTYIENIVVNEMGLPMLHDTESKVNPYPGSFPLVLFEPPTAEVVLPGDLGTSDLYLLRMAFIGLLPPDHNSAVARGIVETQWDNAKEFLVRLFTGTEVNPVDDVSITPFFYFTWNANITAGALLQLRFKTIDDFDYCAI